MARTKVSLAAVTAAVLLATMACSTDTPTGTTAGGAASSAPATSAAPTSAPSASEDPTTDSSAAPTASSEDASSSEMPTSAAPSSVGASGTPGPNDSEWFVEADYKRQLEQRTATAEGDPKAPWLQAIDPEYVDTAKFKKDGAKSLCFSNASISNPWRVTGWNTMQSQVEVLKEKGVIKDFRVADANDSSDQQISDIQKFVSDGDCDALIVSPATTATLTPAVQAACDSGIPVIVFDRGVNTDCAVTFIHPIGGYAYGADGADFLVKNLKPGDKVLALRIGPGIDVLENRWAAADQIFKASELEVVGAEFHGGDGAKIKDIVNQYLQKGDIQGIWTDAGAGVVSAIEAFEDAGKDLPVFVGEDELTFMRKWKESEMNAVALAYSNFQWRTPILAAERIWAGQQVPKEWVLPQKPVSTTAERDTLLETYKDLPDLFYARFGGDDLPAFPDKYTG